MLQGWSSHVRNSSHRFLPCHLSVQSLLETLCLLVVLVSRGPLLNSSRPLWRPLRPREGLVVPEAQGSHFVLGVQGGRCLAGPHLPSGPSLLGSLGNRVGLHLRYLGFLVGLEDLRDQVVLCLLSFLMTRGNQALLLAPHVLLSDH